MKSQTLGASSTPLVYFTLTPSNGVALTQAPAFTLALAASVTQPCYLVAYDTTNPSAGWNGIAGPFTVTNNSLNIPQATLNPPLSLQANQPYVFAIVTSNNPAIVPTPGALTINTPSITLNGAGATATFNASESNYAGGFTASSSDPTVATVSQGTNGNFTVTAVAAGDVTIMVSDDNGVQAPVDVLVTTTEVTIH